MSWETPGHWATEFDHWYLENREPFSKEPPKEIARRAYLAACEARGRHLREKEAWAKVTEEEQRRIRLEWYAVHQRVTELEDAAGAVLRDPTIQARQCLADILRSHRGEHEKGEAGASP